MLGLVTTQTGNSKRKVVERMSELRQEVRWDYLLAKEFEVALTECAVCYMPLGTLERHGAHLPFGLDAMKAHGLCTRAAQEYGGVVLPPLHWGTHGWWAEDYRRGDAPGTNESYAKQAPGTVYIHEGLLINLLLSMLREVEYAGFKVCVMLTGHYPNVQIETVKTAAAHHMATAAHNRHRLKVWALSEPELLTQKEAAQDHGGKWETSFFLELYPDLVDLERCPDPETGLFTWCSDDALEASQQLGEQLVEQIVHQLGQRAAELLEECD